MPSANRLFATKPKGSSFLCPFRGERHRDTQRVLSVNLLVCLPAWRTGALAQNTPVPFTSGPLGPERHRAARAPPLSLSLFLSLSLAHSQPNRPSSDWPTFERQPRRIGKKWHKRLKVGWTLHVA
ncbi:unnamed protein product [Protopolystoma xenopodis]|uniref:Uncharacterized protein n=1 Tax=Protopolystoma xenopodis TaxID=117903 RepID=A0A3S5AQR8_9PLAT|nr:unnamed protein product [Protopolystoma xenopodis]